MADHQEVCLRFVCVLYSKKIIMSTKTIKIKLKKCKNKNNKITCEKIEPSEEKIGDIERGKAS